MSAVSLPDLKAHLNLDHNLDDALLSLKLDAAEEYVANIIGVPFLDDLLPVPATIRQAILMLAAHWYESREAALPGAPFAVPFGVHDLLQSHRAWVV
ncbi:MAG: phage gp6-like head-tail connector protein [Exiguobacterium profundum]|nr:MAG: phage gp6-like head-tail connector protein [Exiguobacterium profundum]